MHTSLAFALSVLPLPLQPQELEVRSLGIDAVATVTLDEFGGASLLRVDISESLAGEDRNGDGDMVDRQLFTVLDLRTGELWDSGLSPLRATRLGRDWVLALREDGVDLTGNGQGYDVAYALFGPRRDGMRVLPFEALDARSTTSLLALPSSSFVLLHDADAGLRRVNLSTLSIEELGKSPRPVGLTPLFGGLPTALLEDGLLDLNGDGDKTDEVWHVVGRGAGPLRNAGFAGPDLVITSTTATPRRFLGLVDEAANGIDGNGDGDQRDVFPRVFGPGVTPVVDVPIAVARFWTVVPGPLGTLVTFRASEAQQGIDWNDDGDIDDDVPFLLDPRTGATRQLSGTTPPLGHGPMTWSPHQEWLLAFADERSEGVDLNANGSTLDQVLVAYDVATGTRTNTGVAGVPRLVGNRVLIEYGIPLGWYRPAPNTPERCLYWLPEPFFGDANGDGVSSGGRLYQVDLTTGEFLDTGFTTTPSIEVQGREVTFAAWEGPIDLNGDGLVSTELVILCRLDLVTGRAGFGPAVDKDFSFPDDGYWLTRRPEPLLGSDENGDGDALDYVPALVDSTSLQLWRTSLAQNSPYRGWTYASKAGSVYFVADEEASGRDLNGDGDVTDERVLVEAPLPVKGSRVNGR